MSIIRKRVTKDTHLLTRNEIAFVMEAIGELPLADVTRKWQAVRASAIKKLMAESDLLPKPKPRKARTAVTET